MQNAITTLKTEKTNLNQHLLDLKRRVAELELMIGDENNWAIYYKKLETHNPERGKRAKQMFLYVLVHLKLDFDPEQLELDLEECFLFASSALAAAEPWK